VLGKLIGPVCCCALHVLPVFLPCEGGITESVQVLLSRGQAAVEAIAAAPDATSRRDADAFDQLQIIRRMMEKAKQQQWDGVLQVRDFIDTLDVRDLPVDRQQTVMCSARPDAYALAAFLSIAALPAAIIVWQQFFMPLEQHDMMVFQVFHVTPCANRHQMCLRMHSRSTAGVFGLSEKNAIRTFVHYYFITSTP
jgi:hypothetical protein